MTREELEKLVDEKDKVEIILDAAKTVRAYNRFQRMISLGFTIRLEDFPFDEIMVFSWIKEELDGRKT